MPPVTGIPFLPSLLTFPLIQEVRWHLGTLKQGEKSFPIIRLARKDDIAAIRITPNEHFLGGKPECGRQPYGLAAAIGEDFGNLVHGGILHNDIDPSLCRGMLPGKWLVMDGFQAGLKPALLRNEPNFALNGRQRHQAWLKV
jgi:hypothetical protein